MKKNLRKRTEQVYKVYVTFYTDGTRYIGFTSKTGEALKAYFGSNTAKDKLVDHKEIIFTSTSKSTAKLFELLLQLCIMHSLEKVNVATTFQGISLPLRDQPVYLNDMLNIRIRASYIKGLPKFKIIFDDDKFNNIK
jgi:hypothetical protein